jgi:hypothetical protein
MGGLFMRRTALAVVLVVSVAGASDRTASAKTKGDHGKVGCLVAATVFDGSRDSALVNARVAVKELAKVKDRKLKTIIANVISDPTQTSAMRRLRAWCRSHYQKVGAIRAARFAPVPATTTTTSTTTTTTTTTTTLPPTTVPPTTRPPPPTSPPETAPPTAPPTRPPVAQVFHQDGSGIATTQTFSVNDTWDLAWSYDCSGFGGEGNFIVDVYNADGSPDFNNAGVNQLGPGGNGVEHFHSGGSKYLEMNSECNWSVTVTT